jgi:hypothetical protein
MSSLEFLFQTEVALQKTSDPAVSPKQPNEIPVHATLLALERL